MRILGRFLTFSREVFSLAKEKSGANVNVKKWSEISICRSKGITLVEALVAALIFIGGLTALTQFHNAMLRDAALVKQRTEALNLAQAKIDFFRSYQTLKTTQGQLAYENIVTGSDPAITGTNATYTRSWTSTESTGPDYKTINMQVTWTDSTGTQQTVRLLTVISKADPALSGKMTIGAINN